MKRNFLYIIAIALFAGVTSVHARKAVQGDVQYSEPRITKQNDRLTIDFAMDFSNLDVQRQTMITLTPWLQSSASGQLVKFAPVVVMGSRRDKEIRRELALKNYSWKEEPYTVIRRRNKQPQRVAMTLDVAYEPWMRAADFKVNEQVFSCRNLIVDAKTPTIKNGILPPAYVPTYHYTYITPPAEPVKERSESYTARLNFVVAKYELLRDYKNNAQVLAEADRIVRELKADANLTLKTLKVTGYASPEGNYNSNMTLSKNRAYAFVNYLRETHGLSENLIAIDWKGEDWDGLRKAVSESNLDYRDRVLSIIDDNSNITRRKQLMQGLGANYRYLLDNYYPPLRRNDYTISYVAKPFSVEEAREVIKNKPQQLSLNEMFLVANSYPRESEEFKEVFDIASRLYPEDPIASLNNATLEVEKGAVDAGMARLVHMNMPEAWNNLGLAYIYKKDYERAKEYFQRAAAAGVKEAATNLDELNKWLENPE